MFRAAMTAAVVLVASAGCLAQAPKAKETAEQKAVRAYLKENLPSGKWEEIRWWIARDFPNGKRSVRLKYRTQNEFGAMAVYDDAFYFKGGKIVEWHKNDGKLFHGFDNEK